MTGFVSVATGVAFCLNVANQCVPLHVSSAVWPRIDLVRMRVLPWGTDVEVIIGSSIPGLPPVPPSAPEWQKKTPGPYQWIDMAHVYIRPGATVLSNADITELV